MHNTALPPWLADDAQLELSFKKGKQPLSHRRWSGDPVPPVEEGRLQRLANDIPSRYQHIQALTWDYETCTAEWRQAIAQAFGYVGVAKPAMPARALAAISRLALYAYRDDCGSLLAQINHPQAIRLLLLVADKNKSSQQRVSTFAKKYPHAALAAVAELLALPEPPACPGYPEIAEKKREESWRTLLRTLLNTHPQLAEQVTPWLSTKAQELLAASRPSMPSDVTLATDRSCLPEILRSPPWRSKKKKAASPRFALTSLTVAPQEYWQPGEREALAASKPTCFFNNLPLDERLASIGSTIVMQELGFQSIEYLFHQYTLCGKRDHFDTEKYFHRYVWWGNACHALQNFDIATLLEAWGDYLVKAYNPNDCWNLYLLMQLPRERALAAWQGINDANLDLSAPNMR